MENVRNLGSLTPPEAIPMCYNCSTNVQRLGITIYFYNVKVTNSCYNLRLEVVSTLLNVFVDIEMTGQAVAFEMKFSYRRPMYEVMKHLWQMDDYKKRLGLFLNGPFQATFSFIFVLFKQFCTI